VEGNKKRTSYPDLSKKVEEGKKKAQVLFGRTKQKGGKGSEDGACDALSRKRIG